MCLAAIAAACGIIILVLRGRLFPRSDFGGMLGAIKALNRDVSPTRLSDVSFPPLTQRFHAFSEIAPARTKRAQKKASTRCRGRVADEVCVGVSSASRIVPASPERTTTIPVRYRTKLCFQQIGDFPSDAGELRPGYVLCSKGLCGPHASSCR